MVTACDHLEPEQLVAECDYLDDRKPHVGVQKFRRHCASIQHRAASRTSARAQGMRLRLCVGPNAFGNALGEGIKDQIAYGGPHQESGSGLKVKGSTAESWGPRYSFDDMAPPANYSPAVDAGVRLGGEAGAEYSGGRDFAADTGTRRANIVVQEAATRASLGVATPEDLKVLGQFPAWQRFDTRLPIAGPSALAKPDGSPGTYTFNERTGDVYWDLGKENTVHAIPMAFRRPTLEEAINDPSNAWTRGPRLGSALTEFAVLSGAGALGLGLGGVAVRGLMGFAADASAYGLRTAYLLNAGGVNATGVLGAEATLGYGAISPSSALPVAAGGRSTGLVGQASPASRERVLSNLRESEAARNSSRIDSYFAREDQVRSGYAADQWNVVRLREGFTVYGLRPGSSAYFADFSAVQATGLDSVGLSRALQVKPHDIYGYRPDVGGFQVMRDILVPAGRANANPWYGPGGGSQYFIRDWSSSLQPIATVHLNKP